jgi:hypothetical protein
MEDALFISLKYKLRWRNNFFFTEASVLTVLTRLFLGVEIPISTRNSSTNGHCIWIVSRRMLLTNSLLGKCATPGEIGGFTLLDVDVGGIPRDNNRRIRSETEKEPETYAMGRREFHSSPVAQQEPHTFPMMPKNILELSSDEDLIFNIEAD